MKTIPKYLLGRVTYHEMPEFIDVDILVTRSQYGGTYGWRKTIISPSEITTEQKEWRSKSPYTWDYTVRVSKPGSWFAISSWLNSQTRDAPSKIDMYGVPPNGWETIKGYIEEL